MSVSETYRRISALRTADEIARAASVAKRRGELDVSSTFEPAATADQCRLEQIWQEVLGIDEVGVDDNFFELGGDSLQVAQVLARMVSGGTRDVRVEVFLDGPTIRQLAAAVASASSRD